MMRKYVKPEIEALALETIDVIATSDNGYNQLAAELGTQYGMTLTETTQLSQTLDEMSRNQWSW